MLSIKLQFLSAIVPDFAEGKASYNPNIQGTAYAFSAPTTPQWKSVMNALGRFDIVSPHASIPSHVVSCTVILSTMALDLGKLAASTYIPTHDIAAKWFPSHRQLLNLSSPAGSDAD